MKRHHCAAILAGNDPGAPERVLATRRRARALPMRELVPVPISA